MKLLLRLAFAVSLFSTIALLIYTPVLAAAPQDYDKLIAQAHDLDHNGEQLAAFIDYYQASQVRPGGIEAGSALSKSLHDGLPVRIPESIFDTPTGPASPIKIAFFLNGSFMTISPQNGETPEIDDPQNNWPFTRITYFYRQSIKPEGDWVCYAIMHSQSVDDQDLSDRMGRLLGLVRQALVEETGYLPLTDGQPFGVWLARHSTDAPGGQEWHNNIYFYDTTSKRSNIEWIREIAHEFSHLGFPAIGGDYTDPEPWANGYYGERLLVRWLARGAAGGPAAVKAAFGGPFTGYINFQKLLIDPYEGDFLKAGMNRNALGRHDGAGMRYLIGMLLAVDDHSGPKVVGDLLWSLPQGAEVDPLLLYSGAADALAKPAIAPAPPVDVLSDSPDPNPPADQTAPPPGQAAPQRPASPRPPATTRPSTPSEPPAPLTPPILAH